jgi:hypothetical protein
LPVFRTLQYEETKGIIHYRVISAIKSLPKEPWRQVSMYISISCNFIIKYYVNRKITSYNYIWIFTKSIWLYVKRLIALTKRESVRRVFFKITDPTLVNTSITVREKHEKVRQHWIQKRKKAGVRIKRVKSDSYLTYGQSCKTWNLRWGICYTES